jgi:hypothetical protein
MICPLHRWYFVSFSFPLDIWLASGRQVTWLWCEIITFRFWTRESHQIALSRSPSEWTKLSSFGHDALPFGNCLFPFRIGDSSTESCSAFRENDTVTRTRRFGDVVRSNWQWGYCDPNQYWIPSCNGGPRTPSSFLTSFLMPSCHCVYHIFSFLCLPPALSRRVGSLTSSIL